MRSSTQTRAAVTRASVGVAVPVLAILAHVLGGGELPRSGPAVLALGIGAVAAIVVRGFGVLGVATTLTVAQAASHFVMASSHAHTMSGTPVAPMLATHLVAIPLTALAIVAVAQLVAVVSSVLRALAGPPRPAPAVGTSAAVLPVALSPQQTARRPLGRGPPTPSGAAPAFL